MAEVDERVSPRTEAGLEYRLGYGQAGLDFMGQLCACGELGDMHGPKVHESIALDRARLAAAVRRLPATTWNWRAAVLRLIEGEKGADHAD